MLSILALFVAIATPALAEENVVCNGKVYCIGVETQSAETIINIRSNVQGWFGFGLGPKMAGSDMFIVWSNGNESTVSARESPSQAMPVVSKKINATSIPWTGKKRSDWAKIHASFKVPTEQISKQLAAKAFIWASSETAPATPADAASTFGKHDKYDKLEHDFTIQSIGAAPTGLTGALPAGASAHRKRHF